MTELSETERLRREVNEMLILRDRAVTIAHSNIEKRLDTLNEFRGALSDQANTFISRAEMDLREARLSERLGAIEKYQNKALGAVALLAVLVPLVLKFVLR